MVKCSIENNVALVQLDNGKVNTISHALAKGLKETFIALEKNNTVEGVILTGQTGAFSAGLDVSSKLKWMNPKQKLFGPIILALLKL